MNRAHRLPPRSDGVRHPARHLLVPLRPAARFLVRRRWRVVVHHRERFPARGGVVVAANHAGVVDGPLLAIFAPRPVHALTKIEMFSGRTGRFLRASGQVPLDRFRTDPRAVRTALRVLRDDGCVGIFPEGARGAGDLERFHRGAAYLALVTGAPVVPVTLLGTREPGGRTDSLPPRGARVDVVVGHPVSVPAEPAPRRAAKVAETTRAVRERMLADLRCALAETGRSLPGPLPPGEREADPGDDLGDDHDQGGTERTA